MPWGAPSPRRVTQASIDTILTTIYPQHPNNVSPHTITNHNKPLKTKDKHSDTLCEWVPFGYYPCHSGVNVEMPASSPQGRPPCRAPLKQKNPYRTGGLGGSPWTVGLFCSCFEVGDDTDGGLLDLLVDVPGGYQLAVFQFRPEEGVGAGVGYGQGDLGVAVLRGIVEGLACVQVGHRVGAAAVLLYEVLVGEDQIGLGGGAYDPVFAPGLHRLVEGVIAYVTTPSVDQEDRLCLGDLGG